MDSVHVNQSMNVNKLRQSIDLICPSILLLFFKSAKVWASGKVIGDEKYLVIPTTKNLNIPALK